MANVPTYIIIIYLALAVLVFRVDLVLTKGTLLVLVGFQLKGLELVRMGELSLQLNC